MKIRILFISVVFLIQLVISSANAQPVHVPCFTLDTKRGCAPLTVNITKCSTDPTSAAYNYDFVNNPTATTGLTTFTYNTPGKYVIRQTVNSNSPLGLVSGTDTVEVLGQPTPQYTVDICEGSLVHVSITDKNYDTFTLNYGDGTIVTTAKGAYTTYIYPNNLPKTISIKGNYIECPGATATKNITPISSLITPDIIDLAVTSQAITTGSIKLNYSGLANRYYKIDYKINNGGYVAYDTILTTTAGAQSFTASNLNTQANTYTFRIQNIDPCNNTSTSSAEIASIIIQPTALNGSNQITFNSNGGLVFNPLLLKRNLSTLVNNATSPYNDNTVFCGTDYCYEIIGTLPTISATSGTNHKSYSASSCIKATYTGLAPVITSINSTVEGETVKIVWNKPTLNAAVPPISFYTVYRKDGGAYFNYGGSNSNYYIDNVVSVANQPYCYEVNYKDKCNNTALNSTNTCTVHLTMTRVNEINNLSWTSYVGYQSGIKEYIVENLDENGNVVLSKSAGLTNSLSETADPSLAQIIYRIKVVPIGTENLISYSNTIKLDLTPQVFLPNIFTPNGDGNNDVLEIKGKYFKSAKMTILNRWGEVVFVSEDSSVGWDGTYKGSPASVDAYGYHIVAFDNAGKEISLKGIVSLAR